MLEGLKNTDPTFCRMTKAILKEQMERNVFTYVDDIVVVSRKKETQLQDLVETFANIRRAQLKLNPEKYVFGVSRGKVLGCLVSMKGIEANPDKINAIIHMKHPGSRKEVQTLTGKIAALNRFVAKIAERSLPFFKVLRGSDTFEWRPEQQEAFEALKEYIQKLPTLTSPQPDQPLILYVSTTHTAVSGALVQEREIEKRQKDIAPSPNILLASARGITAHRRAGHQRINFFGIPAKVENTLVREKIEKYTRALTSTRNNERSFASTPKPWG
jgi:hypothetical protein